MNQKKNPCYRTLEYLTKHLYRVAARYGETGMTAKNVAIVWAPNLLRCKSLEVGGVAALQGVGIQAGAQYQNIKKLKMFFYWRPIGDLLETYWRPTCLIGESFSKRHVSLL